MKGGVSVCFRLPDSIPGFLLMVFIIAVLMVAGAPSSILADDALFKDSSNRVIVVPKNAKPAELTAAAELSKYLGKIIGSQIPVMKEGEFGNSKMKHFFIGNTAKTLELFSDRLKKIPDQGCLIAPVNGDLFIAGISPIGTWYGVCDFLETQGVRWYAPNVEKIPIKKFLVLPTDEREIAPKCVYRDISFDSKDLMWNAHARFNGRNAKIPSSITGNSKSPVIGVCHTFFDQVPPYPTNWHKHRDWFAVKKNGKRPKPAYQHDAELCLTNEELRQHVLARVLRDLRGNPSARVIWVSQNDSSVHSGRDGCYCPRCTAQRKKYGDAWSANLIDFVNFIARKVKKEFPKVKVATLAYAYTRQPPKGLTVAPNVLVVLCQNTKCVLHDAEECSLNQDFLKSIKAWQKVAQNLQIYTYGRDHGVYWAPFPNILSLCRNLKLFYDMGITSMFVQGCGKYDSSFSRMRAYLLSRVMWNPDVNLKDVLKEFTDKYYGSAGKYIMEYVLFYDKFINSHPEMHGTYIDEATDKCWITKDAVKEGDRLFKKALDAVTADPVLKKRVEFAYAQVLYSKVVLNLRNAKPEIKGNLFMVSGENSLKTMAAAKRFDEILTGDPNEISWGEHAKFVPKQNPVGLFSSSIDVCGLKAGDARASVVPRLGGRLVEWIPSGFKENLLSFPNSKRNSFPFCDGYEELASWHPKSQSANADFKITNISKAGNSISLRAYWNLGFYIDRVYSLSRNSFVVKSVYRSVRKGSFGFNLRTRLFLAKELFPTPSFFVRDKSGKWIELNSEKSEVFISPEEISLGTLLVVNAEKRFGVLLKIARMGVVRKVYVCNSDSTLVVEVWHKPFSLNPNETYDIQISVEYIDTPMLNNLLSAGE